MTWPTYYTVTFGTSPQPASPPSPTEQLAIDARKLASEGRDLSRVTAAIDQENRARQRNIEKSLEATLELAKLSNSGKTRITKEFILAYQASNGETKMIRGVEFPDYREDKTKDDFEVRVVMDTVKGGEPVGKFLWSMKNLKDALADKNIVYRIAYID